MAGRSHPSRPGSLNHTNPDPVCQFVNRPLRLYKFGTDPPCPTTRARQPLHPRTQSSTARRNRHRRRTAASSPRSDSALHQPRSIPQSSSFGRGSRHRSRRPASATAPASRSLLCSSFFRERSAMAQRARCVLRRRSFISGHPSSERRGHPNRRASSSSILCRRRHHRPKRHAQTPVTLGVLSARTFIALSS